MVCDRHRMAQDYAHRTFDRDTRKMGSDESMRYFSWRMDWYNEVRSAQAIALHDAATKEDNNK